MTKANLIRSFLRFLFDKNDPLTLFLFYNEEIFIEKTCYTRALEVPCSSCSGAVYDDLIN